MLTVLLAMTATLPGQLPVPTKPATIRQCPTEFMLAPTTSLDVLMTGSGNASPRSNCEVWRDNGNRWFRDNYNEGRLPSKAVQIREQTARWLRDEPALSRAWDSIYQERSDFVCYPALMGGTVRYRLVEKPASSLLRDSGCRYGWFLSTATEQDEPYCALIDGLPFVTVRANSVEELEQKVLAVFGSFVEHLNTSTNQLTTAASQRWDSRLVSMHPNELVTALPSPRGPW